MRRSLLHSLLYAPTDELLDTPGRAGLAHRELTIDADDGDRLHGWLVEARADRLGHLLLCHGNGGNAGDRVLHAELLTAVGFDVLLFDYRGYGRSSGRPSEEGTYRDAAAAHDALLDQPETDAGRIFLMGESLGGAVALDLALARPPAGLVLLSAFTSVRDVARVHYPFLPAPLVPDVYPSLERIGSLRSALLVLHGDRDEVVPVEQGRRLYDAAPEPKRIHVVEGVGHNDIVEKAGRALASVVADWARASTA